MLKLPTPPGVRSTILPILFGLPKWPCFRAKCSAYDEKGNRQANRSQVILLGFCCDPDAIGNSVWSIERLRVVGPAQQQGRFDSKAHNAPNRELRR